MKIGSLFSGIGGLELGLERSIPGAHTVWQVEQNEYARAVLAKHWPNARRHEDVKEVGAHNLEPVDICIGGFPCQDISVAGKGAGLDGARSGLWTEYARIVRELRPGYVVVENVSALLNRGMGRVLADLAACGYDATWDCVPAAAVGAPHRRDRLFIVAWTQHGWSVANAPSFAQYGWRCEQRRRGDAAQAGRLWSSALCGGADYIQRGNPSQKSDTMETRKPKRAHKKTRTPFFRQGVWWEPEPELGRVANGVSRRVDRLRCLGNAVVPQVAEVVGRVIMELDNADL